MVSLDFTFFLFFSFWSDSVSLDILDGNVKSEGGGVVGLFTYEGCILGIMAIDVRGQGLLGAEDGAAEVGFLDEAVLDGDAEDRVGAWDAERNDAAWVWCVEEGGEGGEGAVEEKGKGKVSGRR